MQTYTFTTQQFTSLVNSVETLANQVRRLSSTNKQEAAGFETLYTHLSLLLGDVVANGKQTELAGWVAEPDPIRQDALRLTAGVASQHRDYAVSACYNWLEAMGYGSEGTGAAYEFDREQLAVMWRDVWAFCVEDMNNRKGA